jgi:hypothetical protein
MAGYARHTAKITSLRISARLRLASRRSEHVARGTASLAAKG